MSNGLDHQVTIKLKSPVAAIAATTTIPTRVTYHRRRVTLWVHDSRNVPVSISRATNGAPQNIPSNNGNARRRSLISLNDWSFDMKLPVAVLQSLWILQCRTRVS